MKSPLKQLKIKRRGIALLAGMHFYGNPGTKLKIVGVTGTNGKTTTATMLYRIATALGHKSGLLSTVENIIGSDIVPHNEKSPATTPDPIVLHKLLKKMIDNGCEYAFMEVSSHALDQSRVAGINFTGGIFTNLTHDHLDYHKNFENYFGAKKKFFKMLPPGAFALSNTDDEYGERMLEGIKARKFSYGFRPSRLVGRGADEAPHFLGEVLKLDFNGIQMKVNETQVVSKLLGKFNTYNLLSVWAACKLLDFDMKKVGEILNKIEPPKGRFEHFVSKGGVLVIVDYAHSPDSLEKILSAVNEIKEDNSSIISIFGCGGDRDTAKRKIMGHIGATLSDTAIFTSDNPRSEDPEKIIEQMKEGLSEGDLGKVITLPNRREAIQEGVKLARKGDIIVCAGKGHEDYQEIKGVKTHFDDMEELKKAFRESD